MNMTILLLFGSAQGPARHAQIRPRQSAPSDMQAQARAGRAGGDSKGSDLRVASTWRFLGIAASFVVAGSLVWLVSAVPAAAQLRGHGGPVRAVAVSPDGAHAISGSFDSSAIRWSLPRNAAEQVLRFHNSAVNAVALLPGGRAVTGGEDGRIAVWNVGEQQPTTVLEGHTAPVVALAVSPDAAFLASASWDGTVRLCPLAGGPARVL